MTIDRNDEDSKANDSIRVNNDGDLNEIESTGFENVKLFGSRIFTVDDTL
jgi:hypothetical protein